MMDRIFKLLGKVLEKLAVILNIIWAAWAGTPKPRLVNFYKSGLDFFRSSRADRLLPIHALLQIASHGYRQFALLVLFLLLAD